MVLIMKTEGVEKYQSGMYYFIKSCELCMKKLNVIISTQCCILNTSGSELLSLRKSKWLEGHWLQPMCCTLPKCLCP